MPLSSLCTPAPPAAHVGLCPLPQLLPIPGFLHSLFCSVDHRSPQAWLLEGYHLGSSLQQAVMSTQPLPSGSQTLSSTCSSFVSFLPLLSSVQSHLPCLLCAGHALTRPPECLLLETTRRASPLSSCPPLSSLEQAFTVWINERWLGAKE